MLGNGLEYELVHTEKCAEMKGDSFIFCARSIKKVKIKIKYYLGEIRFDNSYMNCFNVFVEVNRIIYTST